MGDFSRTAMTGLDAAAHSLTTISDNIANNNTIGFKSSSSVFFDLMAGSGSNSSGMGVGIGQNKYSFNPGSSMRTGIATNLQIGGDGFFILKDGSGQDLYSRAGDFQMDKEGYLVNPQGNKLQGFMGDATSGAVGEMLINRNPCAPEATKNSPITGNLNYTSGDTVTQTAKIYDKRGEVHSVQSDFVYDDVNKQWDVTYTVDGDVANQVTSTITFDDSGKIATGQTFDVTVSDGSVKFDFSKMTSYADSALAEPVADPDGFGAGTFNNLSLESGGKVYANYSNGQSKLIGTVAIAKFANNNGLQKVGSSNWVSTGDAGMITIGSSGKQGLGDIVSGSLEGSNVNLSSELVQMISAQRDYQSNAQVIKAGKALDQVILNV